MGWIAITKPQSIYISYAYLTYMTKGYQKEHTCVHQLNYHFVWCPRYRRKLLQGKIKERLIQLIQEKANQKECKILTLEVMPDPAH